MEKYEEFCKKHLARIQGEAIKEESFTSAHQSVSIIQFHGVAVLSPLLTFERKKEMQHYKQKAIELEVSKQDTRKKTTLLNRVHEILENVQVRKVPCMSDLDVEDAENTHQSSEPRAMNGFAILPNLVSLPAFTAQCGPTKLEKTLEDLSLDKDMCPKSAMAKSVASSEESISPNQSHSLDAIQLEKRGHANVVKSILEQNVQSSSVLPNAQEESDAPTATEDAPDPYVMSLQNLLKKSREYIEREQSRRSMRSSSKRAVNESHSDKENDAIKISDSLKEKVKCINRSRSCSPLAFDKPSLNTSNVLLQGAPAQIHNNNAVGSSSFSKADIPAKSVTPSTLDTESDEDLKSNCTVDYESSIVKSLTGSYAKLPSPEPSLSPKMHRRRQRTPSLGHIVINNPINACDLSPMDKSKIMGNALPDVTKNVTISEPVSNIAIDENGDCVSKGQVLGKRTSETFDASNIGKPNHMCEQEHNFLANHVHGMTTKEIATSAKEPHLRDHACTVPSKLHDPYSTIQSPETVNLLMTNGVKPNSLPEKTKRSSAVELNKSYDVETPSPMLLQSQSSQQQVDTPNASEQFLDRVKCRLDLDVDSAHKENNPFAALTVGATEQEKRWLRDQKCHFDTGSSYSNKSEALTNTTLEDDLLKKKMLAFEDMRKRLEEQHAQQLSLLIAEQEKEQELLQKEIEEQERRLKDKTSDVTDSPERVEVHMNNGIDVDWRKINESDLLEIRWTQVETRHSAAELRSGSPSTNSQRSFVSTADSPFYLRGSAASGTSVPRSMGRGRTRWSQVFSQDMQTKLKKVTALAKGFLTRRLMETDKLQQLRKTVKDTAEFMKMFQSEVPLKRGAVSAQDASLHERVLAQLRAALFEIHDIFFVMDASERMSMLSHDREVRREKLIRQMEKVKSPRERVSLSAATQKSLDRKKLLKAVEMGMPNKKNVFKPKTSETRILQPNQGQNAPVNRLLYRQGTFKISEKGVEQSRMKPSESRVPNKVISGVYAERTRKKKPNAVTI